MVLPNINTCSVAVIGLGYVGLPLALELSKEQKCIRTGENLRRKIIGFDINEKRLKELRKGIDSTNESSKQDFLDSKYLEFTSDHKKLSEVDVYIVTVPTPIDGENNPDLKPLENATKTIGKSLKIRRELNSRKAITPIIIYESTVYPGATEEFCVPILEMESFMSFNGGTNEKSFVCGYSPERINPGDKERTLKNIIKVTSGSTEEAAKWVDDFYGSIITAGTHKAKSLKVAEASKIIENTQRDINIALVNELSIIFNKMDIDTLDVLDAAGSKWNFLPFKPGLVGGHCIGVDPYYLTYKSLALGYQPEVVLAGRRMNDGMPKWLVDQLKIEIGKSAIEIGKAKVLLLGITFKENCPDIRNSKIIEVIKLLKQEGFNSIDIVDPWVDKQHLKKTCEMDVCSSIPSNTAYDIVLCCLSHNQFLRISLEQWERMLSQKRVIFDLKGIVPRVLKPFRF